MSETPTHAARALPEDKRLDYLVAVASLVYADGDVADSELAVLRKLGTVLEVSAEGMESVVAAARSPDHVRVASILASFRDQDLRFSLLTDAILVAFADGKVAPGESKEIAEFASALGLNTAQAALIGRYVESVIGGSEGNALGKALADGLADASIHMHPPRGVKWLYGKLQRQKTQS